MSLILNSVASSELWVEIESTVRRRGTDVQRCRLKSAGKVTGSTNWRMRKRLNAKSLTAVLVSVVVGVMVTLISGLFQTPLARIEVDVVQREMPLPWIIQVTPRASYILWIRLVANSVFWTFIALLASVGVA